MRSTDRNHPACEHAPRKLAQAPYQASLTILSALHQQPRKSSRIERALRQPMNADTACMAAVILLQALARTSTGEPPTAHKVLTQWRRKLRAASTKTPIIPILPLAVHLLANLPSGYAQKVLDQLHPATELIKVFPPHNNPVNFLIQKTVLSRKQAGTYNTKPPVATLLAHLAIPTTKDWSQPKAVSSYRVADYACGPGGLLTAVYRRIEELRAASGAPHQALTHNHLLTATLTGCDIYPANTAIAADNLVSMSPAPTRTTRIHTLRYGPLNPEGPPTRPTGLGALDLLLHDPWKGNTPPAIAGHNAVPMPIDTKPESQDIVIMNPPFTRPIDHRALDQNVPAPTEGILPTTNEEYAAMRNATATIAHLTGNNSGNGAAFYFASLAHRMVRPGGTLALILPLTSLAGHSPAHEPTGWRRFRRDLEHNYTGITLVTVAQYETRGTSFSHDTDITEVMVIARKLESGEAPTGTITFINLNHIPENDEDAANLAAAIRQRQGNTIPGAFATLTAGGHPAGLIAKIPFPANGTWHMSRVLDPGLAHTANAIRDDANCQEHHNPLAGVPVTTMSEIATTGLQSSDLKWLLNMDPKTTPATGHNTVPVLKGHRSSTQRSIALYPNIKASIITRKKNTVEKLQAKSSPLHLNTNYRYNSQSTAACITPGRVLSTSGWVTLQPKDPRHTNAIAVWLNTTMGLISHWASANHSQNGMGLISKADIQMLKVLDPRELTPAQLQEIDRIYHRTAYRTFLPANDAWQDPERIELDRAVLQDVLHLTDHRLTNLTAIRNSWCREPTVQARKGISRPKAKDMQILVKLTQSQQPAVPDDKATPPTSPTRHIIKAPPAPTQTRQPAAPAFVH